MAQLGTLSRIPSAALGDRRDVLGRDLRERMLAERAGALVGVMTHMLVVMAAHFGMEDTMNKLIAVAVLALVGATTAQAEVHELKFGGRSARIEIPTGCKKI